MARIVVSEFVSLDGVMEAPGGEPGYRHTGWVTRYQNDEQVAFKLDEVLAHEALLMGRVTYEGFAEAWPSVEGPFGDKMNGMAKYVVSTTLDAAAWNNTTVIGADVLTMVSKLKEDVPGDILVYGSRTLVNWLKHNDLVDEYRLMVFPIVLGSGMRLFDNSVDATSLELVDTRAFGSGSVELTYRPVQLHP